MTPLPRPEHDHTIGGPTPEDAWRIASFLQVHQRWSVFWDKKHRIWRAAEDDPDSDLYTEARDVDTVIGYITVHS